MASCWSGRRGSNSLPPPWQGGALPDELRPHTRCIYPCTLPFVSQTGPPRKLANARFCGEEEKFQCLSQRSCFARLPDKRLTFRRGASDRNRTNDTGIFSPLLYRLSYRGRQAASCEAAATRIGLEPTTPSVTGWCSNQLSYRATMVEVNGLEPLTLCL